MPFNISLEFAYSDSTALIAHQRSRQYRNILSVIAMFVRALGSKLYRYLRARTFHKIKLVIPFFVIIALTVFFYFLFFFFCFKGNLTVSYIAKRIVVYNIKHWEWLRTHLRLYKHLKREETKFILI